MPNIHDETGDEGGDITVNARGGSVPAQDPLNMLLAGAKGAVKGFVEPLTGNIPNEDKKSPVINWTQSQDPDNPTAEGVGRMLGPIAPLALLPELDVPAALGNSANAMNMLQLYLRHPGVVSGLSKMANWAYKGAVGGATQAPQDRATGARVGAEAGVATSALRQAFSHVPYKGHALWALPALAALAWERGWLNPYLTYHAGQAVPAVGAAISPLFPPGVAGALGERAAQATGYDRSNQPPKPPSDDEDERIPK